MKMPNVASRRSKSLHQAHACRVALLAAVGALGILADTAHAASGTWTNTNSGNWSDTGNWFNGIVASGSGFTADFNSIDLNGDVTAHLDTSRTITSLIFGDID